MTVLLGLIILFNWLIGLAFMSALVFVAVHFLSKVW